MVYSEGNYQVLKVHDGYVARNTKADYKHHSHFKNKGASIKCVRLCIDKIIPRYSLYLLKACMRLSNDEKYVAELCGLIQVKKNKGKKITRKRKEFSK